jgi:hypothetical protein
MRRHSRLLACIVLLCPLPTVAQLAPLTDEVPLSGVFSDFASNPQTVPLSGGRFLVAWERFNVELNLSNILVRQVAADGIPEAETRPLLTEGLVGQIASLHLAGPPLRPSGSPQIAATWLLHGPDSCAFWIGRLVGTPPTAEPLDIGFFSTQSGTPCPVGSLRTAMGPGGRVAHLLPLAFEANPDVFFTLYAAPLQVVTGFSLHTGDRTSQAPGPQSGGDLATLDNTFLALWREDGDSPELVQGPGLYARWIDAVTGATGPPRQLREQPDGGSLGTHRVAGARPAAAMVAWEEFEGGARTLLGQVFNADGTPRSTPFSLPPDNPADFVGYSLAADFQGRFAVVWGEPTTADPFAPIRYFLRVFGPSGTPLSDAVAVNEVGVVGSFEAPSVAFSDSGTVLVVWNRGFSVEGPGVYGRLFTLPPLADCTGDDGTLCLQEGRFTVEVEWRDFDGNTGSGRLVSNAPPSNDSGLFWFFDPTNWELMVKVLDACTFADRFWVFAAATTNVEYTLTVTDTLSGEVRTYANPLGVNAAAVTDTTAFATCP